MKIPARILANLWFLEAISLVVNSISWAVLRFKIRPGSELLPLHYNIFYGTDAVGRGYQLYFVPLIGLFIFAVNVGFSLALERRDPFGSKMLVSATLVSQFVVLLAVMFLRSIIVA
jgi:hypothetical protein